MSMHNWSLALETVNIFSIVLVDFVQMLIVLCCAYSGDDLRLDLGGGGGGGGRRSRRDPIDTDFMGLINSRRNPGAANPPPGLMYQPSYVFIYSFSFSEIDCS